MALIPPEHLEDIEALHIMMSCECFPVSSVLVFRAIGSDTHVMSVVDQWDVQEVIKKVVAELQRRKFLVWFDRKCRTRVLPAPLSDSCVSSLQCST